MKSTGIIRRIDELGRIVIPKEIRKTLRIHDGDNLEIFTDEKENIILSKYSSIGTLNESANNFALTLQKFIKQDILITDNDTIICNSGHLKKKYNGAQISSNLLKYLQNRETYISQNIENIKLIEAEELTGYFVISPIVASSEVIGLIIAYSKEEKFTDQDINLIKFVNTFFTKYLED